MTTPATNLNPSIGGELQAGYDPVGHNTNVLAQIGTPVQDATTGLWYAPLVTTAGSTVGDIVATGTITAAQATQGTPVAGGTVSITLGSGQSVVEAQLTGTWTNTTTLVVDGTDDSGTTTNWFTTSFQDTSLANPTNITSIASGGTKIIRIPAAGFTQIRVRCSVFTVADSISVRLIASTGGGSMGGLLLTNDGSFAKESGGNLATLAGAISGTRVMAGVGTTALFTATQTTVGSSNSGDLDVSKLHEISIDITTTAQAGTNPTIQFFWERKGADGVYYKVWQSSSLSAASNTLSTSVGPGLAYNQSLGTTGRLEWTVGGSNTPTWTFTPNIYGK